MMREFIGHSIAISVCMCAVLGSAAIFLFSFGLAATVSWWFGFGVLLIGPYFAACHKMIEFSLEL